MTRAAHLAGFAVVAALTLAAAAGCRDARLDELAARRVAQLEACACASHDGFASVDAEMTDGWRAELVGASDQAWTRERALSTWAASPAHRDALELRPWRRYGYAQSERATGGWWYAVLLLED